MPYEQALSYMDQLIPAVWSEKSRSYKSEWVEVLSIQDIENQKPYVDKMFAKIEEKSFNNNLSLYNAVTQSIESWSQKDQYEIIKKIISKYGFDNLWVKPYFELMQNWSVDESTQLLNEILSMPLSHLGVIYADLNYQSMAIATSNSTIEAIDIFLRGNENRVWVRKVAQEYAKKEG